MIVRLGNSWLRLPPSFQLRRELYSLEKCERIYDFLLVSVRIFSPFLEFNHDFFNPPPSLDARNSTKELCVYTLIYHSHSKCIRIPRNFGSSIKDAGNIFHSSAPTSTLNRNEFFLQSRGKIETRIYVSQAGEHGATYP